jgi:uncharacterized protein
MIDHANLDMVLEDKVAAPGIVRIHDNLTMAQVSAGHSVIVRKSIVSSEVSAGAGSMLEHELRQLIGEINGILDSMAGAIAQRMKYTVHNDAKLMRAGFGLLFELFARQHFAAAPGLIASLCQKVKTNMKGIDKEWLILCHKLKKNFTEPFVPEIASMADLRALAARVDRLYRSIATDNAGRESQLQARYVQNSRLYCSGGIRIERKGVVSSKLHAGGIVQIDGYARGSEIYAEHGVRIREAEAEGGVPTRIRVPAGRSVTIDRAGEGTVIQVGNRVYTIARETDAITL